MRELASGKVAVVTDSTADIPAELVRAYGIHVVPQILIMGDKTWRDGIDIDPPTFYQLLQSSRHFPSTSQASAAEFESLFAELAKSAAGIVAVLISSQLSGTINSAQTAAANLPGIPIAIVDSQAASMMLGFSVLAAAQAASAGGDLATVASAAQVRIDKTGVYFVVDTLEYLHRGGRIGAAARLFGSALNLKPVLEIRQGIVTPVAKIRSQRKALDKVHELLAAQFEAGARAHMSVLHVAAPQEAAQFQKEIEARFHPVEMIPAECGPVIGAHAGPGTVGVAFYVE